MKKATFKICTVPTGGRQRGVALIIGLMLLVMLMLITVVGLQNTALSERMTGNSFDRNTSFQSAENAGKEALQLIDNGQFNAGSSGQYDPPLPGGGDTGFWTKGAGAIVATPPGGCINTVSFSWKSCAANVTDKYANNALNAQ